MPSHTPASALIKLYFLDQAPWQWPVWQDITGIRHGLFPEDDSKLPVGWTRADANDVFSYFTQYNHIDTEDNKIKFACGGKGVDSIPGRKKWSDFVTKSWSRWGINERIIAGLHKHNIHPITIMSQQNSLDDWPKADTYVPIALDTIGLVLFGTEAFGDADLIPYSVRRCTAVFVQRTWARIRERVMRDKGKHPEIEKAALEAFQGTCSQFRLNRLLISF